MWLLGKTMFTETSGDSITARFINIAVEIANARRPEDIRERSYGSAVLAATYRGMCSACVKNQKNSVLVGCPLLLQLWSWERFPIGRPGVDVTTAWKPAESLARGIEKPTVGSMWTRREVSSRFTCHFVFVCSFSSLN